MGAGRSNDEPPTRRDDPAHAEAPVWSRVRPMTETTDAVSLDDVLALIDGNLRELQGRELVSATEVSDLLLDLRMLFARQPAEAVPVT